MEPDTNKPSVIDDRATFAGKHNLMPAVLPRATAAQENFLRDQAQRAVRAFGEAGTAYWHIVTYAREQGVPPVELRRILFGAGWHKSRVAEILSVVKTSDEIYTDYRNRYVGFKLALEKTRGAKLDPKAKTALQLNRLTGQFYKVSQMPDTFSKPWHQECGSKHLVVFSVPEGEKPETFHFDGLKVTVEKVAKTPKTNKKAKHEKGRSVQTV